jgi:hypothetical protein
MMEKTGSPKGFLGKISTEPLPPWQDKNLGTLGVNFPARTQP